MSLSLGSRGRRALQLTAGTLAASLLLLTGPGVMSQPGAPAEPSGSPRETAPIDLSGYWVSIVNEDWRWRMVTPPKGDYTSITMLSAEGKALADAWDPAEDGSCKAYGAAGLMRMPTRLHISWTTDSELTIETDAGMQTRKLEFEAMGDAAGAAAGAMARPSRQGTSVAKWIRAARPPGRPRPGSTPPAGGSLEVTTTNLLPGWLRRNGVPYSERTTLTEYFDRFPAPNGDEWLVVTSIVEDPLYLTGRFVTSSHFRRESNDSHWSPRACRGE